MKPARAAARSVRDMDSAPNDQRPHATDPEFGTLSADPLIRSMGSATVGEYGIRPHVRVSNHRHDTEVLVLLLAGALTDRGRNGERSSEVLTAGSLRILPAGDRRDIRIGPEGARCLVIELDRPLELRDGIRITRRAVTRDPHITRLAVKLRPGSECSSRADALLADLDLTELLARFGREQNMTRVRRTPQWLNNVRAAIDDAVSYPNVDELATIAGVHPLHLVRAFREHFGHSIGDRVRRARLSRAHQHVVETSQSLSTIAAVTGFADQSHMTREFQRAFGASPARMRRTYKG
jgi:AraC family transcriptional regulator